MRSTLFSCYALVIYLPASGSITVMAHHTPLQTLCPVARGIRACNDRLVAPLAADGSISHLPLV